MAWSDAKAALRTLLGTVSITSPIATTIEVVFSDPPARLAPVDTPAFVLFPPAVDVLREPGGWRRNLYTYRARLYVHDADFEQASAIVEAFVEATIDVLDDTSTVRGNGVQIVNGPRVEEAGQFEYGNNLFLGADFFFDIQMGEAKTFG